MKYQRQVILGEEPTQTLFANQCSGGIRIIRRSGYRKADLRSQIGDLRYAGSWISDMPEAGSQMSDLRSQRMLFPTI